MAPTRKGSQLEILTVEEVFTPGQFPKHTYNRREFVENQFEDWYAARGTILVVHGPSKTGKTVLLEKLIEGKEPIWIDGGGLDSVSKFWDRVTDELGGFSEVQRMAGSSNALGATVDSRINAGFIEAGGTLESGSQDQSAETLSVERPKESVVRGALAVIDRPLIIDDIHFVSAAVQEEIVKAVKPLVFGSKSVDRRGRRVIFVSIGNRVQQVISRLDDMRGRMTPLPMQYWGNSELQEIAAEGFRKLNIVDPDTEISTALAKNSFGSPQIMQQLCLQICRDAANSIRQTQKDPTTLNAPGSWDDFYRAQLLEEMGAWVEKLAKGPSTRGQERKLRTLRSGRVVDGYKLSLLAMAHSGPKLTISKSDLEQSIRELCKDEVRRISAPTTILKNMSLIAATKLDAKIPALDTLRQQRESGYDPYAQADLQPVMEYVDRGPLSEVRITEPFFAYYLAWGKERVFGEEAGMDPEEDDWGE